MLKGKESVNGPVQVGVITMKFKDGFSSEVGEASSREVKPSNPATMFFKEKGGVEVVELNLAEFVGH